MVQQMTLAERTFWPVQQRPVIHVLEAIRPDKPKQETEQQH